MVNKFPAKYIKHGRVKLHSGQYSNILYDVNAMLTDREYRDLIDFKLKHGYNTYVGIATGGAIIAFIFSDRLSYTNFAMIKDRELKGKVKLPYCLVDDVVTTEESIREAIKIIGEQPKCIFVVVDRRKKKRLNIKSIYDVEEK